MNTEPHYVAVKVGDEIYQVRLVDLIVLIALLVNKARKNSGGVR